MRHPWLVFLSIGVLAIIVFLFFFVRLQPIKTPTKNTLKVIPGSIEKPIVTFVNPSKGSKNPKVTIVVYSDFACQACQTLAPILDQVLAEFPNQLTIYWKHLPNEAANPVSTLASIASQCAHQQGKFWLYHDLLFEQQVFLTEDQFSPIASQLGLNVPAFENCYLKQDTLPIIQKDYNEGIGLGLTATPALYINGQLFVGAPSSTELIDYVQQIIK
ncbi:DsbA family protein [Patescibacteria group bacterium]